MFDKDGNPVWQEHRELRSKIDVVAINVQIPAQFKVFPINNYDFVDNFDFEVSQDAFILGLASSLSESRLVNLKDELKI